jgi:hypothetical protein
MAKDKGTKKSKGIGDDDFAKPSEAPVGDNWSLTDGENQGSGENDGELFLITPLRKETVATKEYGDKEVIVADVVHLNEKKPAKSEEHEEVFIFGGWLQGALRAYIGERRVLGRLDKTPDKKSGRGYVWKFEDADDDDIAVARAYLESVDPFAKKTADKPSKKSKPEPEPAKKSKKSKPEPEPAKKSKKSKAEPEPAKKSKGKKK